MSPEMGRQGVSLYLRAYGATAQTMGKNRNQVILWNIEHVASKQTPLTREEKAVCWFDPISIKDFKENYLCGQF